MRSPFLFLSSFLRRSLFSPCGGGAAPCKIHGRRCHRRRPTPRCSRPPARRYLVGYPILDNCEIWRSQKPHEHSPLAGRLDGPYARTRVLARQETFKSLCRGVFAARRSEAFIPFECGRSGRNQEARWRRRREIENAHRVGRNGSEQKENRGKRRRAKH